MPLPKLPVVDLDNVNHRRGARERINNILDHSFDDSRRQTDVERLTGVAPVNPAYPPLDVRRYGTNAVPGTTDMTAVIQRAVDLGAVLGCPAYLPAAMGECKITAPITITSGRSGLVGDGSGKSRIVCDDCNGFTVSPGISFVNISGLSVASESRYTDTPNTLVAIDIQGTTASQVYYSRFDDIFIDGFQVCVAAYGVAQSTFTRIDGEFCQRGFVAEQLTQNSFIDNCFFVGEIGTSDRGIVIGDGDSAAEGWSITNTLSYGFDRAMWVRGASTVKIAHCFLDFFGEFGLVVSAGTNAGFDVSFIDNYLGATGTADTGIHLANAVAPSSAKGNYIAGNRVTVYSGSTLVNALLVSGSQEANNVITGNRLKGDTYDCRIEIGTGHIVSNNTWVSAGFSSDVSVQYSHNFGTNLTVNSTPGYTIDGSATYDPPSLADSAGATTTIAVSGAELGDFVQASFSLDLQGITLTAYVAGANDVAIRFQNESGGTLDLASGTLRVRVTKR